MEKSPYTRVDVAIELSSLSVCNRCGSRCKRACVGKLLSMRLNGRPNVDRVRPRIGARRSGRQVNAGEQRGCGEDVHAAETEESTRLRVLRPRTG